MLAQIKSSISQRLAKIRTLLLLNVRVLDRSWPEGLATC